VVEVGNGHGDGSDQKMIKCFTFGKEERETKIGSRQRYM
jgi:hypothetical protein